MTSTDVRYLAFELWKLLRTGDRFRDLRRRYDIARSLRDGGAASSSQHARQHPRVMRLGGTLNRARIVLGERIRRCRHKVNGLAAGSHAGEPWRADARRRLTPALTDLTDAIQRTVEVPLESGAGPTHAEILGALDRHKSDIRECGQFLSDLAAEVREAAVSAALTRYPTLLDALIYLGRRNDIRQTTNAERAGGNEHRTQVAGEPFAFAMTWVHGRCTWQSRRNGAELWDYVRQSARGEIMDPELRETVVPQLRAVDTPEMCRAFWSELLSRFPHIAVELADDPEAALLDRLAASPTPPTLTDDELARVRAYLKAPMKLSALQADPAERERRRKLKEVLAYNQALRSTPYLEAPEPATPPPSHVGDELLRYLSDRPDEMAAVAELRQRFHDADMLTVYDADGLIEFGRRNHCLFGPVGNPELRVERGWSFRSITVSGQKPMPQILTNALSFTGDDRIRLYVRLTAQGRVRVARFKTARQASLTEMKLQMPETRKSDTSDDLVTLDQAAAVVNQSKRTLERYLQRGDLPRPDLPGGGGKAHRWYWGTLRPALKEHFHPDLPARFPASRVL